MESRFGTYVNAVLLILVFSMSTVISFACTNSNEFHQMHHHSSSDHSTDKNKDKNQSSEHDNRSSTPTGEEEKTDCCSNYLVEWEKVEKYASRNISAPPAVIIPLSIFEFPDLFLFIPAVQASLPGIANHIMLPQKQNLRIFIQLFRI